MLVVMSGLPGVGKSAVADAIGRRLPACVLSVDPIEASLWRAGIGRDQPTGLAAYVLVETLARHMLGFGQHVVVDAVNGVAAAREQWSGLAADLDQPLRIIEVICSDADLHRTRLAGRARDIPGFPEPSWDDVLAAKDAFEPWPGERLVLDSVGSPGANVERALGYIGPAGDRSGGLDRRPGLAGEPEDVA